MQIRLLRGTRDTHTQTYIKIRGVVLYSTIFQLKPYWTSENKTGSSRSILSNVAINRCLWMTNKGVIKLKLNNKIADGCWKTTNTFRDYFIFGGRLVREPDLRSTGRGFDSRQPRCSATLGKLFTHVPLTPSSIIWYQPIVGDAQRLGRSLRA